MSNDMTGVPVLWCAGTHRYTVRGCAPAGNIVFNHVPIGHVFKSSLHTTVRMTLTGMKDHCKRHLHQLLFGGTRCQGTHTLVAYPR